MIEEDKNGAPSWIASQVPKTPSGVEGGLAPTMVGTEPKSKRTRRTKVQIAEAEARGEKVRRGVSRAVTVDWEQGKSLGDGCYTDNQIANAAADAFFTSRSVVNVVPASWWRTVILRIGSWLVSFARRP